MKTYEYVGDNNTMEYYEVERLIRENPEKKEFILKMWKAGWLFI